MHLYHLYAGGYACPTCYIIKNSIEVIIVDYGSQCEIPLNMTMLVHRERYLLLVNCVPHGIQRNPRSSRLATTNKQEILSDSPKSIRTISHYVLINGQGTTETGS
jgi:predicted DsbA family dithiol-disulfide isomerase